MTKTEAHALLDAARAGCDIPAEQISAALAVTGDLSWRVVHVVEEVEA